MTDAKNCTACATGKYSEEPGAENSTSCEACPGGFYQNKKHRPYCLVCPIGFNQASTEEVSCDECPRGWFGTHIKAMECGQCPKGYHQMDNRQIACLACKQGQTQGERGNSACNNCKTGRYMIDQGSSVAHCTLAPAGWYVHAGSERSRPLKITPGFVCGQRGDPVNGTSGCITEITCLAGKYSILGDSPDAVAGDACHVCPRGYYSTDTAHKCESCPVGKFANATRRADCDWCLQGQYQDEENASTCKNCAPGAYANNVGQTLPCKLCETGRFYALDVVSKRVKCKECREGKYQSETGQLSCNLCEIGRFSNNLARVKCKSCEVGQYSNEEGQLKCKQCPSGWEQGFLGKDSCDACGEGTMSSVYNGGQLDPWGTKECDDCNPGEYSPRASGACTLCPRGYESPSGDQGPFAAGYCQRCAPGTYYENATTPVKCEACPAGYFSAKSGGVLCTICPSGFSNEGFSPHCDACPHEMWTKSLNDMEEWQPQCLPILENSAIAAPEILSLMPKHASVPFEYTLRFNIPKDIMAMTNLDGVLLKWSSEKSAIKGADNPETPVLSVRFPIRPTTVSMSGPGSTYKILEATLRTSREEAVLPTAAAVISSAWDTPLYVTAAYQLVDNLKTGTWSQPQDASLSTNSEACQPSVTGQRFYLRTHPSDDVCSPPLNLMYNGGDKSTEQNLRGELLKKHPSLQPEEPSCIPCPVGGNCNGDVMVWNIATLKGYWRVPWAPQLGDIVSSDDDINASNAFVRLPPKIFAPCRREFECLGVEADTVYNSKTGGWPQGAVTNAAGGLGSDTTSHQDADTKCATTLWSDCCQLTRMTTPVSQCRNGTKGPLCAVCAHGYTRLAGICVECKEITSKLWVVGLVLGFLALGGVWLRRKLKKLAGLTADAISDIRRVSLILLSLAQIYVSMQSSMSEVRWPESVRKVADAMDLVDLDPSSIFGATCDETVDWKFRFSLMVSLPFVLFLGSAFKFWYERNRHLKKLQEREEGRDEFIILFL